MSDRDVLRMLNQGTEEVAEPTPVAAAGLAESDYCGPASVCFNLGIANGKNYPACYDLCRESMGAYDTMNHPDCRDPGALCAGGLISSDVWGVCVSF